MNVKLGICNFCFPGGGVFAPRLVKEAGLDGMSIEFGSYEQGWPLSQRVLQDIYLDVQQKTGIEYPAVGVSDGDNVPFHARPGDKWDAVVNAEGTKAIDAAAYMKIPLVFFSNFNASLNVTEEDFEYTAKRYRFFCDYAGEKGISVACENPNTPEEQKMLHEMVGRDNFYLFFDSCNHQVFTDCDVHDVLRELYPYYYPVMHVKDGKNKGEAGRAVLGTGMTGFHETIDILKEKNYEGWLVMENFYAMDPMRSESPDDYFELFREDVRVLKSAVRD